MWFHAENVSRRSSATQQRKRRQTHIRYNISVHMFITNPIAVYIVVSKVHDHHHHHHGLVIIIMIIMITSVNSCGMGKYHQLICLLFITDQISNTLYDKYVEWCNHINLSPKGIQHPPPPLTNALYGVITPTHLRKGPKIHHPLRQTC